MPETLECIPSLAHSDIEILQRNQIETSFQLFAQCMSFRTVGRQHGEMAGSFAQWLQELGVQSPDATSQWVSQKLLTIFPLL